MRRVWWVWVHRYLGLFMAAYLIVIGVTGSIITFNPELMAWLNPPPQVTERRGEALSPLALLEAAVALAAPDGRINLLTLRRKAGEPFTAYVEPGGAGAGESEAGAVLYLDPYSGALLGREPYPPPAWPVTARNLMDLINRLHFQLALPGTFGTYLFGVVALLWTIDCLVAVYLTLPPRRRDTSGSSERRRRGWLARWWNPSWLVKRDASFYRLNVDVHRAGGLWLWLLLFVFAWSGVGFNLNQQVYLPVMRTLFGMPDIYGDALPERDPERRDPAMPWGQALASARRLMADEAAARGFRIEAEEYLIFLPDKKAWLYAVRSDRDLLDEVGATTLVFDDSGQRLIASAPTGDDLGATLNAWLFALHMAKVWGLPYRLLVAAVGIFVAVLSWTGVYLWWKKRRARRRPA